MLALDLTCRVFARLKFLRLAPAGPAAGGGGGGGGEGDLSRSPAAALPLGLCLLRACLLPVDVFGPAGCDGLQSTAADCIL
jgi:hypothetical protein